MPGISLNLREMGANGEGGTECTFFDVAVFIDIRIFVQYIIFIVVKYI